MPAKDVAEMCQAYLWIAASAAATPGRADDDGDRIRLQLFLARSLLPAVESDSANMNKTSSGTAATAQLNAATLQGILR